MEYCDKSDGTINTDRNGCSPNRLEYVQEGLKSLLIEKQHMTINSDWLGSHLPAMTFPQPMETAIAKTLLGNFPEHKKQISAIG